MSLAVDLHRRRDHPTDSVVRWLKRHEWTIITMTAGGFMASPPGDELAVVDLMEAVLREVVRQDERDRFTLPAAPRTRRGRTNRQPSADEDLFQ